METKEGGTKIALERIKVAKENQLDFLDLSYLGLEEVPSEINNLPHLTHLFLNHNRLTNIDGLKKIEHFEVLTLNNNRLTKIPSLLLKSSFPFSIHSIDIISFTALKITIYLAEAISNKQTMGLYQIQNLTLALARKIELKNYTRFIKDNQFIAFDPLRIRRLARDIIQVLDLVQTLDRNKHQVIATELAQALDRARITSKNRARYQTRDLNKYSKILKDTLEEITERIILEGIYIHNNPLKVPSPEIMSQGDKAIRTFLKEFSVLTTRNIKETVIEGKSLNEVKVILVGEGASGKTSLVNRLIDKSFNKKEEQTHGIKISKHQFEVEQQPLKVNFWDFGGQEIMHATHQFFLTKRCLYLLVLDSRKDERAEYWLNYIQSFGGDAKVFVILNKNDENPSFDVNRQFLKKKYPNIQNYYKVSCLSKQGIDQLQKDIINTLWSLELRNTPFPTGWFKVKTHLESMSDDYIGYAKYQAICAENQVNSADTQKVLLEFLNDLGVVLNYEQLKWYDTQVLNPLWLTNAVYRIINSPILAESNGHFNVRQLDAIINDPRYQKENPEHWTNIFKFWKPEQKLLTFPETKFLFIVAMMQKFEILFKIDEEQFIIPGLLSDEENIYEFDTTNSTLSFVVEYMDFLPTSIIPRLMIKLNKYIYQKKAWKTGMVLEEKILFHSIANIVLDKEHKKIHIDIQGERRRDFLTVIRETIKEINSSYQDLDITEWIPLPDLYKGNTLLVDYQELLGYEEGNVKKYYSGKLRKHYPVADLLNGIEKPEARQLSNNCHIFISYSHKDGAYIEPLTDHLMPLVRLNKATVWDDTGIDAGTEWEEEIFENLAKADIVLCLISSGFIASDFCYSRELKVALKAHQAQEKIVIPIRIKQVNWDKLPIAKIQGLPNKWLSDLGDNEAWTEISQGIENAIDKIKNKSFKL